MCADPCSRAPHGTGSECGGTTHGATAHLDDVLLPAQGRLDLQRGVDHGDRRERNAHGGLRHQSEGRPSRHPHREQHDRSERGWHPVEQDGALHPHQERRPGLRALRRPTVRAGISDTGRHHLSERADPAEWRVGPLPGAHRAPLARGDLSKLTGVLKPHYSTLDMALELKQTGTKVAELTTRAGTFHHLLGRALRAALTRHHRRHPLRPPVDRLRTAADGRRSR